MSEQRTSPIQPPGEHARAADAGSRQPAALAPPLIPVLVPLLVLACHWRVVHGYAVHVRHVSTQRWELVALALAGALTLALRRPALRVPRRFLPATLVTLVQVALFPWTPPELRGVLLATTLTLVVAPLWLGRRYSAGLHGILLLAQPFVPLFQFQLGYPLRATCAQLAAGLLRLGQLDVTARGTALEWSGASVFVDAPCSGIRMLWSGLLLTFALAMVLDLGARRTALLGTLGFGGILLANGLRAAALFYLEAGIVEAPTWAHEAVGLVAFALVGLGLVWGTRGWTSPPSEPKRGETPCAT
ncbi:MAG: archaeosortase/exosortase family protein [Planctomycetota bacterium]|nr:archaeosortase/exosortase family protein [Planctomycetota bacterium]